jgi:FAD synthase
VEIYKDGIVSVKVTNNSDGVFVTVDFTASDKFDIYGTTTLGYRIWASNEQDSVEVEIYDYQNNEVCEANTFPDLVLGITDESDTNA